MTREEATAKLKRYIESNMIEDVSGNEGLDVAINIAIKVLEQPELIEHSAYIRGFEQGRTQGIVDAKLQPTCNQLATVAKDTNVPCKDTISRQAAIDAACDGADEWDGSRDEWRDKFITEFIEAVPSAQPERKRGKWINRSFNIIYPEWERYKCSACGGFSYSYEFCPHCGADMRGGE